MFDTFIMSSGHSRYLPGAVGHLHEHTEARKVVDKTAEYLKQLGVIIHTFHDDTSRTVSQNIGTLVKFHDSIKKGLDVSVHFNAGNQTIGGTEVLYVTDNNKPIAAKVSKAISQVLGIPDRGAKYRDDLGFLNQTDKNAILIEVCFVDSKSNADTYHANFDALCRTIAEALSGRTFPKPQPILQAEVAKVSEQTVSEFAKEAYEWVKANGVSDGSRPKDNVTREETWVMIHRLAKLLGK